MSVCLCLRVCVCLMFMSQLLNICTAHPGTSTRPRPDSWLVSATASAHFVEWRHEWQHGGLCPFRRSFGCVLLLNQIFRKQCTVRQYTTALEISVRIRVRLKICTVLAFLQRIRKMSTLSSANVTDVNLVLKERNHKIKIKYSMHQYSNSYSYFRQLFHC